jgi:hypothetical protein
MDIIVLPATSPNAERVRFNGIVYRRYPNAKNFADRNYFRAGIGDRRKGYSLLHRDSYVVHHGPIPDGYHVHHKDGNTLNNDPANFVALPPPLHLASHAPASSERQAAAMRANANGRTDRFRAGAAAWHDSAEGRAWHSQHATAIYKQREPLARICDQCGAEFGSMGRRVTDRFCSNACKSAWRRASRKDDEERACVGCGALFSAGKYLPTRYCSISCSRHHRGKHAEAGL